MAEERKDGIDAEEVGEEDWNPYHHDQELGKRMVAMHLHFQLSLPDLPDVDRTRLTAALLAEVRTYKMLPYYDLLCNEFHWPVDVALVAQLKADNDAELAALEAQRKDKEENYGEIEVLDAINAKADYFSRIGAKAEALEALDEAGKQNMSSGARIDIMLHKLRIALFHRDRALMRSQMDQTKLLTDAKGDWDRRNRFKIYNAVFAMMNRDFKLAAELLLDSLATFTSFEVMSYNAFVTYAVLLALLHLPRPELKQRVVDSPDILSVIDQIPHLGSLLNSFYEGRYKELFTSIVHLHPTLRRDPFLSEHSRFYVRELRVVAYTQFLEAYRSVRLDSMASTFGVSPDFIDQELSRFISAGRLHAKIDRVGGMIETTRADAKNAQYAELITKGDALLNKTQRLARIINA